MIVWMYLALILTLALGLSIAGIMVGFGKGLWENIARLFMMILLGLVVAATSAVLIFIAIWPPFNALSLILPFGFVALVIGVLYFVRFTSNTVNLIAEEIDTNYIEQHQKDNPLSALY